MKITKIGNKAAGPKQQIHAHINKQKHRQAVETNKIHLQMLTYISNVQLEKNTKISY